MSHDTSKDPRLLVAELALTRLSKVLPLRHGVQAKLSKQETTALLKRVESNLKSSRYLYLAPEELAGHELILAVVQAATALKESLVDVWDKKGLSPLVRAELRWGLDLLEGLPARLCRPGTSLAAGVDLVAVRVKQITRKDKLWVTRVEAGKRDLQVVTNMAGIEPGQVLGAALLPPVELAGVVSEAMFLGKEPRAEAPGTLLTDGDVDAREAASILYEGGR